MRFTKEELTAFKVYFDKGPVNYPTSQRAADQARSKIEPYLTGEEKTALAIAWSHATMVGEGRREFDSVCKKIKNRLKLDL